MSLKFQLFSPQREIPMKYTEREGPANKNLRKRSLAYKNTYIFLTENAFLFPPTLQSCGPLGCSIYKLYFSPFIFFLLFLFPDHFLFPVAFAQFSVFFLKRRLLFLHTSPAKQVAPLLLDGNPINDWHAEFNFRVLRS